MFLKNNFMRDLGKKRGVVEMSNENKTCEYRGWKPWK